MAKIPFNIKYRPQIEAGEYKVETRDGRPAKVVSFEMTDTNDCPVAAQFRLCAGTPVVYLFDRDGRYKGEISSEYDLFLVTPEEERTKWETAIGRALTDAELIPRDKDGIASIHDIDEFVKKKAAELLSLAREQFIKDGYVIEKKAFHDAVENIYDKHRAEMSVEYSIHCKVEDGTRHAIMNWESFQKVAQKFIDIGKAEALKDLPRWKKAAQAFGNYTVAPTETGEYCLLIDGRYIMLSELMKLPGFKEDEI